MTNDSNSTDGKTVTLGASGPEVGRRRPRLHGDERASTAPSDDAEGVRTIHAALDGGVTLLDTGDFYGMGHNERLVAEGGRRSPRSGRRYQLSVKFGALRAPAGALGRRRRPARGRQELLRLHASIASGWRYIDVYRLARLDPGRPDRGHGRRHR
jgi:aryl-alcohol dehydrogenase-like predicted oxidoreductase